MLKNVTCAVIPRKLPTSHGADYPFTGLLHRLCDILTLSTLENKTKK